MEEEKDITYSLYNALRPFKSTAFTRHVNIILNCMLANVTAFADCVANTFCLNSLLHYDTGSKLSIAISCGKCLKENFFFNKSQPHHKYFHQLNNLPQEEHL